MRRPVLIAMSAVTVAVTLASLRSSSLPAAGAVRAPAPAGVVAAGPVRSVGPATSAPTAPARQRPAAPALRSPRPVRTTAPAAPRRVAPPSPSPRPKPKPKPSPAPTTVTVNGAPADTQYGPVQVQITIRSHRIVRAEAIEYPQGSSRDQEINSRAIPQLDQETLDAQSASIDTVSGATYTSEGYRESLQSALDAAHRAGAW